MPVPPLPPQPPGPHQIWEETHDKERQGGGGGECVRVCVLTTCGHGRGCEKRRFWLPNCTCSCSPWLHASAPSQAATALLMTWINQHQQTIWAKENPSGSNTRATNQMKLRFLSHWPLPTHQHVLLLEDYCANIRVNGL